MLTHDIWTIVLMLSGTAFLGYFVGWFRKQHRYDELKEYIAALQDKNNRIMTDCNENEKKLIDCQTEKKKFESECKKIEQLLVDCQEKLTVPDVEPEEKEIKIKQKKEIKKKPKKKVSGKNPVAKADNLTKVEGIGPKLSEILKNAGLETFKKLSKAKPEKISDILIKAGGNKYKRFDPTTWPDQAKLAAEDKWDELNKWQEEMKGGKL